MAGYGGWGGVGAGHGGAGYGRIKKEVRGYGGGIWRDMAGYMYGGIWWDMWWWDTP